MQNDQLAISIDQLKILKLKPFLIVNFAMLILMISKKSINLSLLPRFASG